MSKKLNILIITHHNVFPINSGAAMVMMSYIKEMQRFHTISVFISKPYIPEPQDLIKLQSEWSEVELHFASDTQEQIKDSFYTNVKRILNKLGILKLPVYSMEENAQFHYLPLSSEDINLISQINKVSKFDIIEVNCVEKFPVIFSLPKDVLKIAVNHEPRFRRTMVQNERGILNNNYGNYLERYQSKFENMLMNLYDGVICFNETDVSLIAQNINQPVYLAPVSAGWDDIEEIEDVSEPVKHIFFLGSGDHHPNFDAVYWYKNTMAEAIFQELGIILEVIGDWPIEKQKKLESPYLNFKGFIKDLNIFASNSIMIVPVRTGGGIRTKIQWAMSKGIPVISTKFGHEGIPCIDNQSYLLAENTADFIFAIKKLQHDLVLRNRVRKEANLLIRKHFSPSTVVEERSRIYRDLLANKLVLE